MGKPLEPIIEATKKAGKIRREDPRYGTDQWETGQHLTARGFPDIRDQI